MKLEHVALQVPDPVATAAWYVEHLGMTVAWKGDGPPHGHFLADDGATVLIEIYAFPEVATPDYAAQHPRVLHLAFVSQDLAADIRRLTAAGATLDSGPEVTPLNDEVAMLRDPWGGCVQLVKRNRPMLRV